MDALMIVGISLAVLIIGLGILQMSRNKKPIIGFFITLIGIILLIVSITNNISMISGTMNQIGIKL
jgi:hypothetical protein